MRQKRPKKISEFFADKGFYIILILCIAAIGISGYVLFFSNYGESDDTLRINDGSGDTAESAELAMREPQETELQTGIPENAIRETEVIMAPGKKETDETSETVSGEVTEEVLSESRDAESAGNGDSAGDVPVTASDPVSKPVTASFFVWPVSGELIERFSVDELVFNETLGDWRVHPGIDIASSLGAQVCAMGDGTVEDVYTDELMGVTVVIDHGNKVKSVYRNLMESVMVSPGDIVYAGDIIGGIGQTAENELLDPPHLHLEMIREGAQIDPCELLP